MSGDPPDRPGTTQTAVAGEGNGELASPGSLRLLGRASGLGLPGGPHCRLPQGQGHRRFPRCTRDSWTREALRLGFDLRVATVDSPCGQKSRSSTGRQGIFSEDKINAQRVVGGTLAVLGGFLQKIDLSFQRLRTGESREAAGAANGKVRDEVVKISSGHGKTSATGECGWACERRGPA